jgi:type II secretory pathway component PulF
MTAVLEAAIYAATAAILSLLVLIPTLATVWAAMNSVVSGTQFLVSWTPWATVAGAGLIALLVSTVVPTLYSMRSSIQTALSG